LKASLVPGFDFTRNLPGIPSEFADLGQSTASILVHGLHPGPTDNRHPESVHRVHSGPVDREHLGHPASATDFWAWDYGGWDHPSGGAHGADHAPESVRSRWDR